MQSVAEPVATGDADGRFPPASRVSAGLMTGTTTAIPRQMQFAAKLLF